MPRTCLRAAVRALLTVALVAGCSGSDGGQGPREGRADTKRPSTPSAPAPPSAPAGLTDAYACRGGFTCGRFTVPLDRSNPAAGTLPLQVAVETDPDAPRGVLVALNGGPGAAGAPLAAELVERLGPEVVAAYRLVALDQRGTGPTALRCPALQRAMGSSFVPPRRAVVACAESIGPARAAYGTDDVVADLDDLRQALGVPKWSLFAVSYGTFVAQQYAVAHPAAAAALVLDSPVPLAGVDTVQADVMRASRRVLRAACAESPRCSGDPVADLATVVRRERNGTELLELLAGMSSVRPSYDSLLAALPQARQGDQRALDRLLEAYRTGFATTPEVFSAGLHASAFCADQRFPWGRSDAPEDRRAAAVRRAVAGYSDADLYPFDRATALDGSAVEECLPWPRTEPSKLSLRGPLPDVPVLVLLGDRDLAAPRESVEGDAAAGVPGARVEVVKGAGHVVTARPGRGRATVQDFLLR